MSNVSLHYRTVIEFVREIPVLGIGKVKHLPVVIPASLNTSGTQSQSWFRGYPRNRQTGPVTPWLFSIIQVSYQHSWGIQVRKGRCVVLEGRVGVCAHGCFAPYTCVKASISVKSKGIFLIQMAAFLLIWNLHLNDCHRICENSTVNCYRKYDFYKRFIISIINVGAASSLC